VKLEHDMDLEKRKHALDEKQTVENIAIENRKLDLEKTRLEIEVKREDRKAAKNQRRDELAKGQLEVQSSLFKMFASLIDKK